MLWGEQKTQKCAHKTNVRIPTAPKSRFYCSPGQCSQQILFAWKQRSVLTSVFYFSHGQGHFRTKWGLLLLDQSRELPITPPKFLSFSVLGRFGACFMCRSRGFQLNYAFTFGPGEVFISFRAWDSEQTSETGIHWTAPIFKQPRSGFENLGSGIETLGMAQPGICGKWEGLGAGGQIGLRFQNLKSFGQV